MRRGKQNERRCKTLRTGPSCKNPKGDAWSLSLRKSAKTQTLWSCKSSRRTDRRFSRVRVGQGEWEHLGEEDTPRTATMRKRVASTAWRALFPTEQSGDETSARRERDSATSWRAPTEPHSVGCRGTGGRQQRAPWVGASGRSEEREGEGGRARAGGGRRGEGGGKTLRRGEVGAAGALVFRGCFLWRDRSTRPRSSTFWITARVRLQGISRPLAVALGLGEEEGVGEEDRRLCRRSARCAKW